MACAKYAILASINQFLLRAYRLLVCISGALQLLDKAQHVISLILYMFQVQNILNTETKCL